MCKKFILGSSQETIENRFNLSPNIKLDWVPKYIVSPGEESLIITQQNPKQLTLSRYGMTPAWAKQPMNLINARAEGNKNPKNDPLYTGGQAIFMKPAFKKPLFSQRCVVIADAFIEWSTTTRQPFLIYLRGHERPFGMAGLYDVWINPDTKAELHRFTIITVPGNSLLHRIPAARMPVIIPKGREKNWLRPSCHLSEILGMLEIFPAGSVINRQVVSLLTGRDILFLFCTLSEVVSGGQCPGKSGSLSVMVDLCLPSHS